MQAAEKVQELLNFRDHMAFFPQEGLPSATICFSSQQIASTQIEHLSHLPHKPPRLGWIHSGYAATPGLLATPDPMMEAY